MTELDTQQIHERSGMQEKLEGVWVQVRLRLSTLSYTQGLGSMLLLRMAPYLPSGHILQEIRTPVGTYYWRFEAWGFDASEVREISK